MAHPETPLLQILTLFLTRRISCIPIVNQQGKMWIHNVLGCLLDVCMKFDILNLARETAYFDLETPVSSALQKRSLVIHSIIHDSIGL